MISDPKYSFSVVQKYFFVVSSKVSIFHQILLIYKVKGAIWTENGLIIITRIFVLFTIFGKIHQTQDHK